MSRTVIFLMMALAFSQSSCEEGDVVYSKNMTLLTGGDIKSWVVVDFESPYEGEGINCKEDDILTLQLFNAQYKVPVFTLEDNVVRCKNSDPFLVSFGGWRLNNQQTRLILSEVRGNQKNNDIFDILELSERKMILRRRNENFYNLVVFYETITYESR